MKENTYNIINKIRLITKVDVENYCKENNIFIYIEQIKNKVNFYYFKCDKEKLKKIFSLDILLNMNHIILPNKLKNKLKKYLYI